MRFKHYLICKLFIVQVKKDWFSFAHIKILIGHTGTLEMSQTTTRNARYVPPSKLSPFRTISASLRSLRMEIWTSIPSMVTIVSPVSCSNFVSIGTMTTFMGGLFPVSTWTAATSTNGIPILVSFVVPPVPLVGAFHRVLSVAFFISEQLTRLLDTGINAWTSKRVGQSHHSIQQLLDHLGQFVDRRPTEPIWSGCLFHLMNPPRFFLQILLGIPWSCSASGLNMAIYFHPVHCIHPSMCDCRLTCLLTSLSSEPWQNFRHCLLSGVCEEQITKRSGCQCKCPIWPMV